MSVKITTEGKELLREAVLNGEKITFKNMELVADQERSPSDMHLTVNVSSVEAGEDNAVIVRAMVRNDGFTDAYYFAIVNIYTDNNVLFAYEDSCDICIPPETIRTINAIDVYLKIDANNSELCVTYGSYVLQRDFEALKTQVISMQNEVDKLKKTAWEDITSSVTWDAECQVKMLSVVGKLVVFRATYKTDTGYAKAIAKIPEKYCPAETIRLNAIPRARIDAGKTIIAELNYLNGNLDVEVFDGSNNSGASLTVEGSWLSK